MVLHPVSPLSSNVLATMPPPNVGRSTDLPGSRVPVPGLLGLAISIRVPGKTCRNLGTNGTELFLFPPIGVILNVLLTVLTVLPAVLVPGLTV